MKARPRSSGSSSRVRFSGSSRGLGHQGWYRAAATYYDRLYDPRRTARAYAFFQDLFRRHGPVRTILDVGCGTFAVDLPLVRRGYRVVGTDLSGSMLRVARRNLRQAGFRADLARGDMRTLRLGTTFDVVLCLGTAFNYLVTPQDVRAALRTFRTHVRPGGLLVLDLTHFDPWIRRPVNARAEVDYRDPDGTRVAVYAFNEQDSRRRVHVARFLTVVQTSSGIRLYFDESPLRIWRREDLGELLAPHGFRVLEWWGDLRLAAKYKKASSPRLVCVASRTRRVTPRPEHGKRSVRAVRGLQRRDHARGMGGSHYESCRGRVTSPPRCGA